MLNPQSTTEARVVPASEEEPGTLTVAVYDTARPTAPPQRWLRFYKYNEAERFALDMGVRAVYDGRRDHG